MATCNNSENDSRNESRRSFLTRAGKTLIAAAALGELSVFGEDALTSSSLEEKLEAEYKLRIIGNTSKQNLKELASAFKSCEMYWENFRKEIDKVYFIDLKSSFWTFLHKFVGAVGGAGFGFIMLDSINEETIMHETAHIYHESLKPSFSIKWKKYVDKPYGSLTKKGSLLENEWQDGSLFLGKEGFVTPYGSTSLREDVATYQETLFIIVRLVKHLNEQKKPVIYNYVHPIFFLSDPKGDTRYQGKISLLKEYGFISHNDFNLVKPLFW